jgi:hypothetical protein
MIKKKLTKKILVIIVILMVLLLGILKNTYESNLLKENNNTTKGEVIGFHFSNNTYSLKYEFYVEGEKYIGYSTVHYFECNDGTPGCQGEFFTIIYSKENPNINDIDLGSFNSKKFHNPKFW